MENTTTATEMMLNDLNTYYLAFIEKLPQVGIGLLILLMFYLVAGPASRVLVKPLTYAHTSALIKVVIERIINLIIVLFGFYLFLKMVGLSAFAVAILSGTGVVGLIIGFAFKDIAENFMSSLLLSIQKPFRLGDVIEVSGNIGVAKQVTARATTLVDFDGNHIQIPNSVVYKNIIRNFTANPNSRGSFVIGIGYDADASEAQRIGLSLLKELDAILDDPEPQILVDQLASATLNLKVYFWTDTQKYSLVKISSLVMKKLVLAYEAANISMPDDAREIVFPQGIPIHSINNNDNKESSAIEEQKPAEKAPPLQLTDINLNEDDLESDDADIRKQALLARDPEQGGNIL